MAGEARNTASGAYVELDPINTVRNTASGAYVELDPINAVRSTAVGAYVELLPPVSKKKKKTKPPRPPKKPKGPRPSTKYRSVFAALSAWWPAISSAGSKMLFDIIGNNDAPMQGSVPWLDLASWGYSANLPGLNADYFNAGTSAAICDTDMSIAAWVRFDTVPTATDERHNIIGRSTLGGDSYVLGLRCPLAGTQAYVYWQLGGTLVFGGTYQPVVAGETYHIVVAGENGKAPGTWSLYLDGELLVNSGYSGAVPFENEDTYIGRIEDAGDEGPMNGQIIDIQIYGRPLTPAEVQYLYAPATRWDLYKPPDAWVSADIPLGTGGGALSGLSGLTGLSAIMG